MRSVTAAVDEVQMANKTFHRARLTNLSQDAGRRRLQAAGEEEDLLLGDPGHRLEHAERALKRALAAARSDERAACAGAATALGPRDLGSAASRATTGSNTETVVSLPPIHTFSGGDAIARPFVGREPRHVARGQAADDDAPHLAAGIANCTIG